MRFIDTHAHLDFDQFDDDREELLRQLERDSLGVINVAVDEATGEWGDKLSREWPLVWSTLGIHPDEASGSLLPRIMEIFGNWERMIKKNKKIVAIGEVGLDYRGLGHNGLADHSSANRQKAILRQFVTFSQQKNLPLILHCREAYGDLLTLLGDYQKIRGVIHCFSGSKEVADRAFELGLDVSFTANITYPNNDELRRVVAWAPLEKIMLETDSPFLAPQANRGHRNDPRAIREVAKVIAAEKNISIDEVYHQTTSNACKLFSLGE